jgi:hypothetical protein
LTLEGIAGSLEPASMAGLELARADWIAQSIRDWLPKLDRSSGRDHERLVGLLVNYEVALRSAQRSTQGSGSIRARSPGDRASVQLEQIPMARRAVVAAIESAGLAEDLASAQKYLGQAPGRAARPPSGLPDPSTIGRIRALGRPRTFQGITTGVEETGPPNTLTLTVDPLGSARDPSFEGKSILAALLLAAALAATWRRASGAIRSAALAVVLAITALAGGPTLLAGGLGLAALTWWNGRAR